MLCIHAVTLALLFIDISRDLYIIITLFSNNTTARGHQLLKMVYRFQNLWISPKISQIFHKILLYFL